MEDMFASTETQKAIVFLRSLETAKKHILSKFEEIQSKFLESLGLETAKDIQALLLKANVFADNSNSSKQKSAPSSDQ